MTPSNNLSRLISVLAFLILSTNSATGYGETYTDVAIGDYSLCALNFDGSPSCVVENHATRLAVPDNIGLFTSISSGQTHICGITIDKAVRCWGDNDFNQQQIPVSSAPFIQLDAGRNHTCAVDSNDKAWCWGLDSNNQATPPDDGVGFIHVAAGALTSCGIRGEGTVECWGSDESVIQVPADLGSMITIDVGSQNACGLSIDGSVQCWGVSAISLSGGPYTNIAVTSSSVCGLKTDGKINCNFTNQSPQGYVDIVAADSSFTAIESGLRGTCGLLADGDLKCLVTQLSLTESADSLPPPYDLQAFQYSDTTIELMWQAAGTIPPYYTAGFNIYRDEELLAFTENGNSFIDNTLIPGISYRYQVAQVRFDGRLTELSESTGAGSSLAPTVGLDLSASLYSTSALELFWKILPSVAVDSSNIEFTVKRNGMVVYIGDGRSFFDEGLLPNTRYRYSVELRNPTQVFATATIALVTKPLYSITSSRPSVPSGLRGEVYSSSALEMFWDRSEAFTAIKGYEISRDDYIIATSNGTSFLQTNLQAMTSYKYDVVAIDIYGQRSIPSSIEMTTRP